MWLIALDKAPPQAKSFASVGKSKCVELSVYRNKGDNDASVSLSPAKGFNISNHLVEGGWNDVVSRCITSKN